MANLFSGLEAFGLGKLSKMEVYDEKGKNEEKEIVKEEKAISPEGDAIFDKSYTCPVCDKEFKSKMIKSGKVKLLTLDTDLRPRYQYVDSLKYDAVACPHCGYAALNRFFSYVSSTQAKLIKENISSSFKGLNETCEILSYDEAIARHKLALVNAIVKRAKVSERAYTCLKIAWLLRGKAEALIEDTPDYEDVINNLQSEELEFILNAYEGFVEAFSKEIFPMCGMDENTSTYLVADLARRVSRFDEAGRWVSKVLISRDANERIKSKAREIKEFIKQRESNYSGK